MCASKQRNLIDTTIARTTLESENCKLVRSMIAFEIMAKKMEYELLVAHPSQHELGNQKAFSGGYGEEECRC